MTRITAGRYGGRTLQTPKRTAGSPVTRPTSELVRSALGNALQSAGGLEGAAVLDLYAGTGALGLELLSRGAGSAVLVERDRAALTVLRANVAALGATATVVAAEVASFVAVPHGPFDVLVADPPYEVTSADLAEQLAALHANGSLVPGADLVLERPVRVGEFEWPEPLIGLRTKRYGDTSLCYGRAP